MTITRTLHLWLPCCGLVIGLAGFTIPARAQSTENTVPSPNTTPTTSPLTGATQEAAQPDTGSTKSAAQPIKFASAAMHNLKLAIDRARQSLSAQALPSPNDSKVRLVNQMQSFDAYLSATGPENANAWKRFLKWNELLAQVAANEPDLKVLTDVQLRYQQNIKGFEFQPYQEMRKSIADYIAAVRFGDSPDSSIKILDRQLEGLAKLTEAESQASELERMRELSQMVTYLHSARQAPELVAAIRAAYSQPNVRLQVSESVVNRAVGRGVAQPNPVNECVLGTRVLGQSFINGQVLADLQPQSNGVGIRLTLQGQFHSDNVGHNRGVKVYTTGTSSVYASKLITFTPQGTFSSPATASTNLQTQINGIDHRFRIVERIATKKAHQQLPEANAIGQYRLETRLANQFNSQIEQQLSQGGGPAGGLSMLNQQRVELVRLGVPHPTWSLASSSSHVLADVREADITQLSAPGPSPLPKNDQEIVAEVHQSLPINLAHTVLAGRTLHSWEMDDLLRQYTSDVPAELVQESEGKPWSITFSGHQPIEIEFKDNMATITLRIVRMANEDQELNQPATVTAKYKPVLTSDKILFERQGDVDLTFVRAASGFRSVALRSFFKGKFDKLFREQTQARSRFIPTRMPNLPNLTIMNVVLDKGWAQVTVH